METLPITPSYGTEATFDEKATIVGFGDGFEQRTPTGLNSKRLTFNLVWDKIPQAKAESVVAFIRARGATQAFLWTPPPPYDAGGPVQFVFRMPAREKIERYDCRTITVQAVQDFNPVG